MVGKRKIDQAFGSKIERQFVIKRDGTHEFMYFDQITKRIDWCIAIEPKLVYTDPILITQKVVSGAYSGIKTTELDTLAAETAASLSSMHPEYAVLAARISISNMHKQTCSSFLETMEKEYAHVSPASREPAPLVSKELIAMARTHKDRIEGTIDYKRDFFYSYFGYKTLERAYLAVINDQIVERPQHMFMRISLGIHLDSIDDAMETYEALSNHYFSHATPTMFNAGTPRPSLASCYLMTMKDDSIEGIYETLKDCAILSKNAGGIGINISRIRGTSSHIRGTNGKSSGIIPMLRNFNETARYVDQGGGKRKGSFAIYLEPWHVDFPDFLLLRKPSGKPERRCLDLFLGIWMNDLFMKRSRVPGATWTFFCPNEAQGLSDVHGEAFDALYQKYENDPKLVRKTMPVADVWKLIIESEIETGAPYMLYKDACNRKSNMQHLGTIRGSNLCCEIIQFTSPEEIAVCNLASLSLPKFVVKKTETSESYFDHAKYHYYVKMLTRNLNKTIDRNFYPLEAAKNSNLKHRPIGLGVQGEANVFFDMNLPYLSPQSDIIEEEIFETLYHGFLEQSCELAQRDGPHESYPGSPMSKGILQFDFDNYTPISEREGMTPRWNWKELRENIAKHGVRNIHGVAPMPTATTAQMLGNVEAFEAITSLIYVRKVLSGEFTVVCDSLVNELIDLKLWTLEMKNQIIENDGSIAGIEEIPLFVREKYKTVWEMSQKKIIDRAAVRQQYVDQSMSLNIFMREPTFSQVFSMHLYGWEKNLKTGMYYLRTDPSVKTTKFTLDAKKIGEQQISTAPKLQLIEPPPPSVLEEGDEEEDDEAKRKRSKYADCSSCQG